MEEGVLTMKPTFDLPTYRWQIFCLIGWSSTYLPREAVYLDGFFYLCHLFYDPRRKQVESNPTIKYFAGCTYVLTSTQSRRENFRRNFMLVVFSEFWLAVQFFFSQSEYRKTAVHWMGFSNLGFLESASTLGPYLRSRNRNCNLSNPHSN